MILNGFQSGGGETDLIAKSMSDVISIAPPSSWPQVIAIGYIDIREKGIVFLSSLNPDYGGLWISKDGKAFEALISTGYNYVRFFTSDKGCIISSPSQAGVWYYEFSTGILTQLANTDLSWNAINIDIGWILSNNSTGSYTQSIRVFNDTTKAITYPSSSAIHGQWSKHQKVPGGVILISSGSGYTPGLAYYSDSTKTITQLSPPSVNTPFQEWYVLSNGGVIFPTTVTSYSYGIVYWDPVSTVFSLPTTTGRSWRNTIVLKNSVLFRGAEGVTGGDGIVRFDMATKSATFLRTDVWTMTQISETEVLLHGSGNTVGAFVYDDTTGLLSANLLSTGWTGALTSIVQNGVVVYGSTSTGVHFYNSTTKTMSLISSAHYTQLVKDTGDDLLIAGMPTSGTNNTGLFYFNPTSNTLTNILSSAGKAWAVAGKYDHYILLTNTNTASAGIALFDTEAKTAKMVYTAGYSWIDAVETDYGFLLSSSASANTGILYFKKETQTVTKPYASGYGFGTYANTPIGYLLIGSRASFTPLIFNQHTETFTPTTGSSPGYSLQGNTTFTVRDYGCFFQFKGSTSLYFLNYETKSIQYKNVGESPYFLEKKFGDMIVALYPSDIYFVNRETKAFTSILGAISSYLTQSNIIRSGGVWLKKRG